MRLFFSGHRRVDFEISTVVDIQAHQTHPKVPKGPQMDYIAQIHALVGLLGVNGSNLGQRSTQNRPNMTPLRTLSDTL